MRNLYWSLCVMAFSPGFFACQESKFKGGNAAKTNQPNEVATTPETKSIPTKCDESTTRKGLDVVFVIDNSGSNVQTDPGTSKRAEAVKHSFNLLTSFGEESPAAASTVSIVSFPTKADQNNGANVERDWVGAEKAQAASIANGLNFTKNPVGFTPYGAGLAKAKELMTVAMKDDRKKLVVLVSDGEPTDLEPLQTKAIAKDLQDQYQSQIVSIIITAGAERSKRIAAHRAYMKNFNYSDTLLDELVGAQGQPGLVDSISNKVLEINAYDQLKAQFEALIDQESKCE